MLRGTHDRHRGLRPRFQAQIQAASRGTHLDGYLMMPILPSLNRNAGRDCCWAWPGPDGARFKAPAAAQNRLQTPPCKLADRDSHRCVRINAPSEDAKASFRAGLLTAGCRRRALQIRVPRFNSGRGLHSFPVKSALFGKPQTDKANTADTAGAQIRAQRLCPVRHAPKIAICVCTSRRPRMPVDCLRLQLARAA